SSAITSNYNGSQISCNGAADGEATAAATGGTAPYTYAWSNGATTATITGVIAGTYNVTVTDANGCTSDTSVTIVEPTALTASIASQTNMDCNGGANGAATVTETGGTAPYTYTWSNGATTATITGVTAATYNVTVTDANGCTSDTSVTIVEPTALTASIASQTNMDCNGGANGAATVTEIGGTAPYTYVWSNSATTATITGVVAGTYNVTVTDANGCTSDTSVTITEPTALTASITSQTNIDCNGGANGAATVTEVGGTAPYTYVWSNSATTATITGVTAGTYNVTVTDAKGCTSDTSVTITEPTTLTASITSQTNIDCNGGANGAATVTETGGTAPYTYVWSNGATTATITGVVAGIYNLTVTDANGCTSDTSVNITEPIMIDNNITQNTNILTADQAGATYQWYSCPNTLLAGETNQSFTATSNGDYKVVITNGSCSAESICVSVSSLSIDSFKNQSKFSMYPNPSRDYIQIKSSSDRDFQIITQLGQIIKTFKTTASNEAIIYVGDLSEGMYLVRATHGVSKKLIIKK
ncbi:T9SS type A sorting domain-containing protein, partial [Algibacter amylolyticus]